MTPVQLLRATEEAVGDASLKTMHDELIELRRELCVHQAAYAQVDAELQRLLAENVRAAGDVQRIEHRDRLMQEAEMLKKKIPWVEYDEAKSGYQEEKGKLVETQKALKASRQRRQEDDTPLKNKQQAEKVAKREWEKVRKEMDKVDYGQKNRGGQGRGEVVEGLAEVVDSDFAAIARLETQSRDNQKKIEQKEANIEKLEAALGVAEAEAQQMTVEQRRRDQQLRSQITDLNTQMLSVSREMEECREEEEEARKKEVMCQRKLAQYTDRKEVRKRQLDAQFNGIGRAIDWIQGNRARFRGPVHGPIALEMECVRAVHAKMLESQIPRVWMSYFVVAHPEDQDLLRRELKSNVNYAANIALYQGDASAPLGHELGRAQQYARYGMTHTMDEIFTAPLVVKKVLDDNFSLTKVFVTGGEEAAWGQFFDAQPRANVVFTPGARIQRRRSKYNPDAVSTNQSRLRNPQFLANENSGNGNGRVGAEDEEKEREAAALELNAWKKAQIEAIDKRKRLEPQERATNERMAQVRTEMRESNAAQKAAMGKVRNLKTKLTSERLQLTRLSSAGDPMDQKPALERSIAKATTSALGLVAELGSLFTSTTKLATSGWGHVAVHRELHDQIEAMKKAQSDRMKHLQEMEQLVKRYEREVDEMKRKMHGLHTAAKEATGWPLEEAMETAFAGMPGTVTELRSAVTAKEDEAEGVVVNDPGARERYARRQAEIAENQRDLEKIGKERDGNAEKIKEIKETWVTELRRIADTINQTFSRAFPVVGCAGEVVLNEGGVIGGGGGGGGEGNGASGTDNDDDNFANYAMEVRVKFREEEALATLDANRQSGGERSVSTILYLVALQKVAAAPFRVVDEINQGMDPVNERKVFKLLVDAATAPNTPQCFLLTPKLLPELPFSREVTVLQIMNGPAIHDVARGFTQDAVLGLNRMNRMVAATG